MKLIFKINIIIIVILFICTVVSAANVAWTVDITSNNQLEPVTFGYNPEATDDSYNPNFDELTINPVVGKVVFKLDSIFAKKIKSNVLSWDLIVTIPAGDSKILWDAALLPDNINLSIIRDATLIDMKKESSLELSEGRYEYTISAVSQKIPVIITIDIMPSEASVEEDKTQQFSAKGYDQYDAEMTGLTFTWASTNTTVGDVSASGLFTAKKAGTTTVTATCEGKSGEANVTVTSTPATHSQVTLSLPDLELKKFQSGIIPLKVENITDGEGILATVTWDSRIIRVESINVNQSVFGNLSLTCNLTENSAIIQVIDPGKFNAESPTPFADIVYKAMGKKNGYTDLTICDASWSSSFNKYECCCDSGSVTITGIKGDFNNNNEIDIGDSSKVAYMVAGKVDVDSEADFNGQKGVDTGDAAIIAWYLIGKVPTL